MGFCKREMNYIFFIQIPTYVAKVEINNNLYNNNFRVIENVVD